MPDLRYPSLYQINTRVWLTGLSLILGERATLDDIPDAELDRIAEMGFEWVWFLSVWQTGLAAQRIQQTLPDSREDDIAGSRVRDHRLHDASESRRR